MFSPNVFRSRRDCAENSRFAEMWPIDFRVNASELHVQSANARDCFEPCVANEINVFPLEMFSAECSLVTSTACSVDCFVRPLDCSCNGP